MRAQESLSADAQAKLGWHRLLQRSGAALLAITGIILVVALLPYPSVKKHASHGRKCSGHDHLRHVIVLHRHGERSPVRWYDFEGDWGWDSADIGIGKLTVNGMKQAFQVGQSLRATYSHNMILGEEGSVTCYSTDVDRTVDTAHSVLLGLLSEHDTEAEPVDGPCACRPEHGKRSSPDCLASCLQLSKVPATPEVQVRPWTDAEGNPDPEQDAALYQTDVCKGYDAYRNALESSDKWLELPQSTFSDAAAITSALVDDDVVKSLEWPGGDCKGCQDLSKPGFNHMGFMETIWSDLVCYESISAPYDSKYTNKEIFQALQPMSEYVWRQRFSAEAGPLAGGVLLHEWLQLLQQSAEQWRSCDSRPDDDACAGSPAKMTIYSAHDTTVFSLLAALGATSDSELPGFTSHVAVELWETHNSCEESHDFSVRVLYNHLPFDAPGAPPQDPVLKVSPFCKAGLCSLEELVAATSERVVAPEDCDRGTNLLHEPEDTQCCKAEASS